MYPAKFIVDKHTLKGAFYKIHNDYLGDIPLEWPTFYNGYYVWNVDPGDLIDQLDAQLKNNTSLKEKARKRLQEIRNDIRESDNNYIFYAKLKKSPPPYSLTS